MTVVQIPFVRSRITTGVQTEIKAAARRWFPIQFGIQIIKAQSGYRIAFALHAVDQLHHKPHRRIASGHKERGGILLDGSFQCQRCSNRTEGEITGKTFHVTFPHRYVQHRRKTSAIASRYRSLIQTYVLQRLSVEDGKIPEQVVHIIHRDTVKQHLRLFRTSSTHTDSRLAFRTGIDPRQCMERLHHIRFAQDGRHRLYLRKRKIVPSHLSSTHKRTFPLHHHLFQPACTGKLDVQSRIGSQPYRDHRRKITHIPHPK